MRHSVPGWTWPQTEALIEQLRRLRWTSTRIAAELNVATSTVCAARKRHKAGWDVVHVAVDDTTRLA